MVIAFWALLGNGVIRLDAMQVQDGVVLVALWVRVGSGSSLYSSLSKSCFNYLYAFGFCDIANDCERWECGG